MIRSDIVSKYHSEKQRWESSSTLKMCIAVFMWEAHPLYPFLLLLNRDEYHSRPTEELAWWDGGEILGGRDALAKGTWLACSRHGRFAFLTNVRDPSSVARTRSRGELPVRFLQSTLSTSEFAAEVNKEANQYDGFNLILIDMLSRSACYVTNRPKESDGVVTQVSPGIHVLTNASLNTPWPKAQRVEHSFKEFLTKHNGDDLSVGKMIEEVMMDTTKVEDWSKLPGILEPEFEHQASSAFVDCNTSKGRYGTRSQSCVLVFNNGEVRFYERYLQDDLWRDQTVTFQIKS